MIALLVAAALLLTSCVHSPTQPVPVQPVPVQPVPTQPEPVQPVPSTGLTIRVLNLVPARGDVLIAVFASPDAYEARTPALRSVILSVDSALAEWHVDDLPAGAYAAVAYQDLNGNRALDKGQFGIPKEPYGFSNGAKAAFGPPPFDQARFPYDGTRAVVEIRLRRR